MEIAGQAQTIEWAHRCFSAPHKLSSPPQYQRDREVCEVCGVCPVCLPDNFKTEPLKRIFWGFRSRWEMFLP